MNGRHVKGICGKNYRHYGNSLLKGKMESALFKGKKIICRLMAACAFGKYE